MGDGLKVMVLAGGPDAEREVSLASGREVAGALERAGHAVRQRDIDPADLSALDAFSAWGGDVVFPVLHGRWGEGGRVQAILDERNLCYVGSAAPAAMLCMDKQRTKLALEHAGIATPAFEVVTVGEAGGLTGPVVVKPVDEGSSIGVAVCRTAEELASARARLHERYVKLMVERLIVGREMTVGVVSGLPGGEGQNQQQALPPIEIRTATGVYDYDAKYVRDDTQYLMGEATGLSAAELDGLRKLGLRTHRALGCRHLSRVDVMLDGAGVAWVIEVNTLPGFTTHSLLPMAARAAGLEMPALVDHLVRLAKG